MGWFSSSSESSSSSSSSTTTSSGATSASASSSFTDSNTSGGSHEISGSAPVFATLQHKFKLAMESIDRSRLMPMEADAYRCCADCLEGGKERPSADQCKQQCQQKVNMINQIVARELQDFQKRVEQCNRLCEQKMQDLLPPGAKYGTVPIPPEQQAQLREKAESCVRQCEVEAMERLPRFVKGLEGTIDSARRG